MGAEGHLGKPRISCILNDRYGAVVCQLKTDPTLYTSKTYLLSATQTPTQRADRSYARNAPPPDIFNI